MTSPPRKRRWPWIAVGAVLAAVAVLIGLQWATIRGLALTGTAYGARVACSCRFAGGRSLGDCRKDFEPGMGLVSLDENAASRSVTAHFPFVASQTATFREGWGCQLEPWTGSRPG